MSDNILYYEKHPMTKWSWLICAPFILLFLGIAYVQLIIEKPVGTNPMSDTGVIIFTIIFGVIVPVGLILIRGEVLVTAEAVRIRLLPLYKKTIKAESIQDIKLVEVKALQQFGGWGIRWNGKWGFILRGNSGIEIMLKNGSSFVISSRQSTELFHSVQQLIKTDH